MARFHGWRAWLWLLALTTGCCWAEDPGPADGKKHFPLEAKVVDPDGDKLTIQWVQVSGPKVRIADANSAKTYFIPSEAGQYVFEIRVSDGKDEVSRRMTWNVTKPNQPPVAMAGADQNAVLTQKVVVDGGKSTDPDGTIVDYRWRLVEAPKNSKFKLLPDQISRREFFFEPAISGDYLFELTVFDGKDWSAPSQTTIHVAAVNKRPVIVEIEEVKKDDLAVAPPPVNPPPPAAGAPPIPVVKKGGSLQLGQTIVLDGSGSSDPLGDEMEYLWRQVDDERTPALIPALNADKNSAKPGQGDNPLFCPVWVAKPAIQGTYRFVLELTAGKGDRRRKASSEPVVFVVSSKNGPPVARIKPPPTKVEKGEIVTLDGSPSTADAKDAKLQYYWGWAGGNKVKTWIVDNGARVQFKAEEEGEYDIQLVVEDEATREKSKPVAVKIPVSPANRTPTIDVPEKIEAVAGQVVRVTATVEDADNDRTEIEWAPVPPPNVKLTKEVLSANPLVFTPPEKGQYVFRVVVRDARSQSEPKLVQILVSDNVNLPPTAVVEGPRRIAMGEKVVLSGERSSDPEKKFLTFLWKQTEAGPRIPGTPPDKNTKSWEFTPAEAGEYQVSLTVSDGVTESEPRLFSVLVEAQATDNHSPVAKIAAPPVLFPGEEASLNGAESSDPDAGDKITFRWRIPDQEARVELLENDVVRPRIKCSAPGTFRVELVVNDGKADSAPAYAEIVVRQPNQPPEARPEGPHQAQIGQEIVLQGGKSFDPDGKVTEYHWAQMPEGGPNLGLRERELRKETIHFRALKAANYVFSLTVVDDKGMKSKLALWTVNVGNLAAPPVAIVDLQGTGPYEIGKPVVISGAHSSDPEQRALKFHWRQSDGPEKLVIPEDTTDTLRLTPQTAGDYTLELKVSNGLAASTPMPTTFRVTGPSAHPAARIAPVEACEPEGEILLDASPSVAAAGKRVEQYRWEVVSAPEGAKVSFGLFNRMQNNQKAQIILMKAGEYTFELKVFDGKSWSDPARVTVKTRAPNVAPEAIVVAVTGYTEQDLDRGADLVKLPHIVRTDAKANANTLFVEEQREVLLDGTGATDPDKGPKPLLYRWKQISGPRPDRVSEDGPILRLLTGREGVLLWSLVVHDGKADSPPAQVRLHVLKKGTLPVAKPARETIEALVAVRNVNVTVANVVLDGTPSTAAPTKTRRFIWKQVEGDDLQLPPEKLSKEVVGLRIYHPGKYRFLLTIFDGDYFSLPTMVQINVREPAITRPAPEREPVQDPPRQSETPRDQSGALLPPPKNGYTPAPKSEPRPEPKPELKPELKHEEPSKVSEPHATVPPARAPEPKPEPVHSAETKPVRTPAVEQPRREPVESADPKLKPVNSAESSKPVQPIPEPVNASGDKLPESISNSKHRIDDPLYQRDKKKLEALVQESGLAAENKLIAALDNRDWDLRTVAAYALVRRGAGSVPALLEVLEKGSSEAKREAHWALKELSKESFGPDLQRWRKWWADQSK